MHEQLDKTTGNAGLDDCLNLVVGAVREIRNRPTSVDEDLVVKGVDELGKNRKSGEDLNIEQSSVPAAEGPDRPSRKQEWIGSGLTNTYSRPLGLRRLASAEVTQRPGGVPKHAEFAAVSEEVQQR